MNDSPFENVKNQIGFCGIWCGSCAVGDGALKGLTRRYEEVIDSHGLEKWAPNDFDFQEFQKGLKSIQAVSFCPGCVNRGGRDDCEIRVCTQNKKLADCSECDDTAACQHHDLLQMMQSGAQQANLYVKIDNIDRKELFKKWLFDLKTQWPSRILFIKD